MWSRTGIDDNGDRKLDDVEIDDSAYVCHGTPRVPEAGEGDANEEPTELEALLEKSNEAMRDSDLNVVGFED